MRATERMRRLEASELAFSWPRVLRDAAYVVVHLVFLLLAGLMCFWGLQYSREVWDGERLVLLIALVAPFVGLPMLALLVMGASPAATAAAAVTYCTISIITLLMLGPWHGSRFMAWSCVACYGAHLVFLGRCIVCRVTRGRLATLRAAVREQ